MEQKLGRDKCDNLDIPASFIIIRKPVQLITGTAGTDLTGSIETTTRTVQTKEINDTNSTVSMRQQIDHLKKAVPNDRKQTILTLKNNISRQGMETTREGFGPNHLHLGHVHNNDMGTDVPTLYIQSSTRFSPALGSSPSHTPIPAKESKDTTQLSFGPLPDHSRNKQLLNHTSKTSVQQLQPNKMHLQSPMLKGWEVSATARDRAQKHVIGSGSYMVKSPRDKTGMTNFGFIFPSDVKKRQRTKRNALSPSLTFIQARDPILGDSASQITIPEETYQTMNNTPIATQSPIFVEDKSGNGNIRDITSDLLMPMQCVFSKHGRGGSNEQFQPTEIKISGSLKRLASKTKTTNSVFSQLQSIPSQEDKNSATAALTKELSVDTSSAGMPRQPSMETLPAMQESPTREQRQRSRCSSQDLHHLLQQEMQGRQNQTTIFTNNTNLLHFDPQSPAFKYQQLEAQPLAAYSNNMQLPHKMKGKEDEKSKTTNMVNQWSPQKLSTVNLLFDESGKRQPHEKLTLKQQAKMKNALSSILKNSPIKAKEKLRTQLKMIENQLGNTGQSEVKLVSPTQLKVCNGPQAEVNDWQNSYRDDMNYQQPQEGNICECNNEPSPGTLTPVPTWMHQNTSPMKLVYPQKYDAKRRGDKIKVEQNEYEQAAEYDMQQTFETHDVRQHHTEMRTSGPNRINIQQSLTPIPSHISQDDSHLKRAVQVLNKDCQTRTLSMVASKQELSRLSKFPTANQPSNPLPPTRMEKHPLESSSQKQLTTPQTNRSNQMKILSQNAQQRLDIDTVIASANGVSPREKPKKPTMAQIHLADIKTDTWQSINSYSQIGVEVPTLHQIVNTTKHKKDYVKFEQLDVDVDLVERNIIRQKHESQVSFMQYVPEQIKKENKTSTWEDIDIRNLTIGSSKIIGSDMVSDKQFKVNKIKKQMSNCSLQREIYDSHKRQTNSKSDLTDQTMIISPINRKKNNDIEHISKGNDIQSDSKLTTLQMPSHPNTMYNTPRRNEFHKKRQTLPYISPNTFLFPIIDRYDPRTRRTTIKSEVQSPAEKRYQRNKKRQQIKQGKDIMNRFKNLGKHQQILDGVMREQQAQRKLYGTQIHSQHHENSQLQMMPEDHQNCNHSYDRIMSEHYSDQKASVEFLGVQSKSSVEMLDKSSGLSKAVLPSMAILPPLRSRDTHQPRFFPTHTIQSQAEIVAIIEENTMASAQWSRKQISSIIEKDQTLENLTNERTEDIAKRLSPHLQHCISPSAKTSMNKSITITIDKREKQSRAHENHTSMNAPSQALFSPIQQSERNSPMKKTSPLHTPMQQNTSSLKAEMQKTHQTGLKKRDVTLSPMHKENNTSKENTQERQTPFLVREAENIEQHPVTNKDIKKSSGDDKQQSKLLFKSQQNYYHQHQHQNENKNITENKQPILLDQNLSRIQRGTSPVSHDNDVDIWNQHREETPTPAPLTDFQPVQQQLQLERNTGVVVVNHCVVPGQPIQYVDIPPHKDLKTDPRPGFTYEAYGIDAKRSARMARDDTVLPAVPFVSMTSSKKDLRQSFHALMPTTGYLSDTNLIEKASPTTSNKHSNSHSPINHSPSANSMNLTSPIKVAKTLVDALEEEKRARHAVVIARQISPLRQLHFSAKKTSIPNQTCSFTNLKTAVTTGPPNTQASPASILVRSSREMIISDEDMLNRKSEEGDDAPQEVDIYTFERELQDQRQKSIVKGNKKNIIQSPTRSILQTTNRFLPMTITNASKRASPMGSSQKSSLNMYNTTTSRLSTFAKRQPVQLETTGSQVKLLQKGNKKKKIIAKLYSRQGTQMQSPTIKITYNETAPESVASRLLNIDSRLLLNLNLQ